MNVEPDHYVVAATTPSHPCVDELTMRRKLMLDYLKLRLELDDMHGVQDAASDIREIDAQIRILRGCS